MSHVFALLLLLFVACCRAERFGTDYKDPAELPKFTQQARLQRLRREGFATGIDLFSEVRRKLTGLTN